MSKYLLAPAYLTAALSNNQAYQRACQLLWLNWPEDVNLLYNKPVEPADVRFARALQNADLVKGRVHLDNYRDVSMLIAQNDRWFSANAKQALLAPFQG